MLPTSDKVQVGEASICLSNYFNHGVHTQQTSVRIVDGGVFPAKSMPQGLGAQATDSYCCMFFNCFFNIVKGTTVQLFIKLLTI
jgi:hypothetical protein